jgi:hypothetical protein
MMLDMDPSFPRLFLRRYYSEAHLGLVCLAGWVTVKLQL